MCSTDSHPRTMSYSTFFDTNMCGDLVDAGDVVVRVGGVIDGDVSVCVTSVVGSDVPTVCGCWGGRLYQMCCSTVGEHRCEERQGSHMIKSLMTDFGTRDQTVLHLKYPRKTRQG